MYRSFFAWLLGRKFFSSLKIKSKRPNIILPIDMIMVSHDYPYHLHEFRLPILQSPSIKNDRHSQTLNGLKWKDLSHLNSIHINYSRQGLMPQNHKPMKLSLLIQ